MIRLLCASSMRQAYSLTATLRPNLILCIAEVRMLVDFYEGAGPLNVDVYKVGHDGSANGTDEEFMQAMNVLTPFLTSNSLMCLD